MGIPRQNQKMIRKPTDTKKKSPTKLIPMAPPTSKAKAKEKARVKATKLSKQNLMFQKKKMMKKSKLKKQKLK